MSSNLSIALAMILAAETPNLDRYAIGDTHLKPDQWAYGRFQMRLPMLKDLTLWSRSLGGHRYDYRDAMNPGLEIYMAAWWLNRRAGANADVATYCKTWNGGRVGRSSRAARDYYRRAMTIRSTRPAHYAKAVAVVRKAGIR